MTLLPLTETNLGRVSNASAALVNLVDALTPTGSDRFESWAALQRSYELVARDLRSRDRLDVLRRLVRDASDALVLVADAMTETPRYEGDVR